MNRSRTSPYSQPGGSLSLLLFFVLGAHVGVWASQLPEISRRAGLALGSLGVLLAALSFASLVASVLVGSRIDKWGRRPFVVGGLGVMAASFVGFALPQSAELTWVSAVVFGASIGVLDVSINAVGSDFERAVNANHMLLLQAGFSAGGAVAAWAVSAAANATVTASAILVGTASMLTLTGAWALIARFPEVARHPNAHEMAAGSARRPMRILPVAIMTFGAIVFFSGSILENFAGVFFRDTLGANASEVAFAVGASYAGGFIARITVGAIAIRKPFGFIGMAVFSCAAGVILLTAVALSSSLQLATASYLLVGFLSSLLIPTAYSLLGRVSGRHSGRLISRLTSISHAAFLLAPLAAGMLAESVTARAAVLLASIGYVAAAVASCAGAVILGRSDSAIKRQVNFVPTGE